MCSVDLIIGDEDTETFVCLKGAEMLIFFLLGKRNSLSLASFCRKPPGVGVSHGCRA